MERNLIFQKSVKWIVSASAFAFFSPFSAITSLCKQQWMDESFHYNANEFSIVSNFPLEIDLKNHLTCWVMLSLRCTWFVCSTANIDNLISLSYHLWKVPKQCGMLSNGPLFGIIFCELIIFKWLSLFYFLLLLVDLFQLFGKMRAFKSRAKNIFPLANLLEGWITFVPRFEIGYCSAVLFPPSINFEVKCKFMEIDKIQ